MSAWQSLRIKVGNLADEKILESLEILQNPWDTLTAEEQIVSAALLHEWESRHGGNTIRELKAKQEGA